MTNQTRTEDAQGSRRDFLKTTAVAAAGAALTTGLLPGGVHAAGSDAIKVGLIGCGGRGNGALKDVLLAAPGVTVVALADAFRDKLDHCRKDLVNSLANLDEVKQLGNKVDVPEDRCYVGLDAYERLIKDSGANYIMLATPPGFRPTHLEAAVAAGKNIFTEKPVATDVAGIRKVLAAYDEAQKKGLHIVAGTQRRHDAPYIETIKRIHDGAIGEVRGGHCHWDQGILWRVPRMPGWGDLEAQMRNWYNYTWLCGDHIVEQHVHNLDVINWAIGSHPVKALGFGFRTRTDPDYGHIYDFFSVGYEYPGGVLIWSSCRQIKGCEHNISETVVGSKGVSQVNSHKINDKSVVSRRGAQKRPTAYVQEHTDLIASIRKGEPINELKNVAESTLTAIIGRMSAYSGQPVTWDWALKDSKEDLMPKSLSWEMALKMPPVAIPGKTPLI
jgi:predicted dehydrogenase